MPDDNEETKPVVDDELADAEIAAEQAAMPLLSVEEIMHWGVDPEGKEALIIVESATQGPVRLLFKRKTLSELVSAAQLAGLQASKNAQAMGEDTLSALVISSYRVGSMPGGKMTILIIDPDTQSEMVFGITSPHAAINIGRALVQEGMAAQKIQDAIGGAKIIMPGSRLMRPN